MITFQKNKKNFLLSENGIKRIKEDIKELSKLPLGITVQSKEFDFAYYIKIIISKNNINIDQSNKNYALLPDSIAFLIVLDNTYPDEPPKIFCQTNVRYYKLIDLIINYVYIVLLSKFNGRKKFI
jgi:ubiquitin-protein ligase